MIMIYLKTYEKYLQSDSRGYNIGEYVYHVTPLNKLDIIKEEGLKPQSGISLNGEKFKNRLYLATSLIAAYDISVNFGSYRDDREYAIIKLSSDCLKEYDEDPLFVHGIYVDYSISEKYIIEIINCNDLFDKFDEQDFEDLY